MWVVMAIAVCLPALGQATAVSEGKPVAFKYDYDTPGMMVRLYDGGAPLKLFMISEVTPVSTNAAGVSYTFKVTLTAGLARGMRTVTARIVEADGTESEDSNAIAVKVKAKAPWNFSLW